MGWHNAATYYHWFALIIGIKKFHSISEPIAPTQQLSLRRKRVKVWEDLHSMNSSVSQSGSVGSYLNSDSNIDILWHHNSTGTNAAWLMDGAANFSSTALPSFPGWDLAGINDFNHDGEADILWRNYATGENCVWFMDDVAVVSSTNLNRIEDLNWRIEGTGDFNADGKTDILWRNDHTGANTVWLMDGTVHTSSRSLQAVSDTTWQIEGTGDFNADGKTDIFWRNYTTGANTVWLMDGTSRMGGQTLPSVKDTSWQPLVQSSVLPAANLTSASSASSVAPSQFNIEIDYRFDTRGWFTPARRAVLEKAVSIWETIIVDEFANVPAGTALHVTHPETGQSITFNSTRRIDDVVIFVGSRNIDALAFAGATGTWYSGSQLETRWQGADFEPWTGFISFDRDANWFFDATPGNAHDIPKQANDFLSVAVHEIGHILGVGSSYPAFDQHVSGQYFHGPTAIARNGGNPIPLDPTLGHIQDGYTFRNWGENALDPTITVGTRKLPTVLDLTILDDIGYQVNYNRAYKNAG